MEALAADAFGHPERLVLDRRRRAPASAVPPIVSATSPWIIGDELYGGLPSARRLDDAGAQPSGALTVEHGGACAGGHVQR